MKATQVYGMLLSDIATIQTGYVGQRKDGNILYLQFADGNEIHFDMSLMKGPKGDDGLDGASIVNATVKNKHLILTKDDGIEIDCGVLPTSDYDDTELRGLIDDKVDKVTGKSLVDDTEIARLSSVDNYDDTDIKASIKTVSDGLMASAGYSADYKTIDIVTVGGDKKYIDIKPVIEHASLTELMDVDSTNKGNGKALVFNEATGKHEYSASSGTDELVKMDASGDAKYLSDLLDKVTVVNESGILKVKKLDGQEVTIEEINYLKGLTMNVMDLVNMFANGGVKIINTPVATYADLLMLDKSSFIEGISYLVYVLADETHDNAKTTYLVDKTSTTPTYFGFADSHRDFTTNPINLVNEITGKLGIANIDLDALWSSLTVDNTYKTETSTNNVFSTHGAKALYDELVQAIGLKANTSDFEAHTSDTDIHVSTIEKEAWNGKIDKTSIATVISSACTHEQVSSAKALYEVISLFNDEIGKSEAVADLTAEADKGQKSKRICYWNGDTLNTPYKAGLTTATTGYAIFTSNSNTYSTIICFATGINNIYTLRKQGGTWATEWVTELNTNHITGSITSSSTNNQVPGALTVYNELSKKAPVLYDAFESTEFKYKLKTVYGLTGDSTIQDVITALNGNSNKDYGFVAIYTNSNTSEFNDSLPSSSGGNIYIFPSGYGMMSSYYDRCTVLFIPYRKDEDIWINPCIGATLQGWRRMCGTKVADSYNPTPVFSDETNYKIADSTNAFIEVKNGWCFVNLPYVNCVLPKTVTLMNELPKPRKSSYMQFVPVNNASAVSLECGIKNDGTLQIQHGTAGAYYRIVFSYPVAES